MIEEIKKKAKELLHNKQVDLIIGYKRSSDRVSAMPGFFENEEDADELIWDAHCVYNLSRYLREYPGKKIGIVLKPCDAKSVIVLLQENQIKREDVFIIGVECNGVVEALKDISFAKKCRGCEPDTPKICDYLVSSKDKKAGVPGLESGPYEEIRKFEAKSADERFKFWAEEFSRCIRCYACRQVCPMCYCPRCVAEQTMPVWFSKMPELKGNLSWNVTRAMHLAGRCIDCGECERACPAGIPIRNINKKIEKDIKELFNYESGSAIDQKGLFASFDKADPDNWIK